MKKLLILSCSVLLFSCGENGPKDDAYADSKDTTAVEPNTELLIDTTPKTPVTDMGMADTGAAMDNTAPQH